MNDNYAYNYYTNQNTNINQNKSKKLLYIIIILLLVIIITVVGLLSNSKKSYSRTIMIYMVGSNLESRGGIATAELAAIDYQKANEQNINVVLIAGGAKKWYNDYIDTDETSIFELTENGFEKVKQQDRKNMGNPETLTDFINYTYENYKTDKYDLLFWNHGGAIAGSEYDELSKEDNLSLVELNSALKETNFNEKNKLEAIFFRTCLNGTIEVANTFKDFAEYLISSEEITYGTSDTSELKFINKIEKTDTTKEIGKKFVATYREELNQMKEEDSAFGNDDQSVYSTYSVVNLSKIDTLTNTFLDFISSIDVSKNFAKISKVRANLFQYGSIEETYDMIDLYNLVNELQEIEPEKAKKVMNAFENAIEYNWATDERSRGLSIYFPYNGSERYVKSFLKLYNDFDYLSEYKEFIKSFNNIKLAGPSKRVSYSSMAINKKTSDQESDFTLELTDEQINNLATAQYVVYRDNKDGYYRPIYSGGTAKVNGNNLEASIRNKQLKVKSTKDGDELILTLFEQGETEKFVNYYTYVVLQKISTESVSDWKFDNARINLILDKETNKIEVISTIYSDEEHPSSEIVNISDYDSVAFSASSGWTILDDEGNYVGPIVENGKVKGNGIITGFEEKPGQYKFDLAQFDEEYDYYCVFILTDIYGNKSYSKLVKMN